MKIPLILGDGRLAKEIANQTGWANISRKKDGFDVETETNFSRFIPQDTHAIINCIANTDTYSSNKESHWKVNYDFVYHLSRYCLEENIKLIHISTDYVYANSSSQPSSEEDVPVHAENWYSYTKLLGDSVIELILEDYLICRCTHKDRNLKYEVGFIDKKCNFTYTDDIAKMIIGLIEKDARGIFNIGNDSEIVYDYLKKTNPAIIASVTPIGIPKDTSMKTEKMKNKLNP